MSETKRDNPITYLMEEDMPVVEIRAALCHVARTCREPGVYRLREVVLAEEPIFYADAPTRRAS